MAHTEIPNNLRRTLQIAALLMLVSTFAIIALGMGFLKVHTETKSLESFLKNAVNVQPNFEQSLMVYTETTKDVSSYLLELRPDEEKDYVQFISDIEGIGHDLKLNIDVQSLESKAAGKKDFMLYNVSFLGSLDSLKILLKKLEAQDYYVGIERIDYRDLSLLNMDNSEKSQNIDVIVKLFIKS